MSVAVVIPWAGTDPDRLHALAFVGRYYAEMFPSFKISLAVDAGEPFSRARACNRAIDNLPADVDTIVLNDADALVPSQQLEAALGAARDEPGFVQPFTLYRKLGREASAQLSDWRLMFDGLREAYEWEQESTWNQSVCVVSYAHWMEIGGYDERYQGWGYEDLDLQARMTEPLRRIEGPLVHLYHPPAEPNPANEKLYRLTHG